MGLKRKLGLAEAFCFAAGAMISSGLFVLPGQAYKLAGPAAVISYGLAALMMIPALFSQTELATAMPKSGGSYFFIERSMGAFSGTLAGFANWLSVALKSAFAMVGIGAFTRLLWPEADFDERQWEWLIKAVAVGCCLVFTVMNLFSVKTASRTQVILVIFLLAGLFFFIAIGLPQVQQHPNFDDAISRSGGNIFPTAALVFISFGGLTKIASVGEEVVSPGRTIPRAMFLAYVIVSVIYVIAVTITIGVVDGEVLGQGPYGNLTPLSIAARNIFGRPGMIILSIAAMLAFITTGNSGILAASRSPMSMSRDALLPKAFSRISKKYSTPYVSILLTSVFMILIIVVLNISNLVKVASTMMLILFLLVNVAVLIMRSSKIPNYRPLYVSPLFPWIQIAGIIIYSSLIFSLIAKSGMAPLITLLSFFSGVVLWYFIYVRKTSTRQSALLYIVRKVVDKEITRGSLDEELREIALERDDVVHDRFDHLIKSCEILDLPAKTTAHELFEQVAELLSKRFRVSREVLLEKFEQREDSSSTVIRPGLAVPHIIIDGWGLFDIIPVRCKEGIVFSPDQPPVTTAFILVGTSDERNYHLRALMAIAQVVQERDFERKWMQAVNIEDLRDAVLLSPRLRE
jgi:amino acid transporter/mannitol/fructose-specific phosphotransferase system IIA component (Ntr-type)